MKHLSVLIFAGYYLLFAWNVSYAFVPILTFQCKSRYITDNCETKAFHSGSSKRSYSSEGENYEHDDELRVRLAGVREVISRCEERRPPNPKLAPHQVVKSLLSALMNPDEPLPEAGFRLLIRSATPEWKDHIRMSVGAPEYANEELIASALGAAIARPKNQFGILVDADQTNSSPINTRPSYSVYFPSDVVDYDDGYCWLECQLRGRLDDKLLVIMGWQMKQRDLDGAWLIQGIDWQDFRDEYRPGIGREEWMRICG